MERFERVSSDDVEAERLARALVRHGHEHPVSVRLPQQAQVEAIGVAVVQLANRDRPGVTAGNGMAARTAGMPAEVESWAAIGSPRVVERREVYTKFSKLVNQFKCLVTWSWKAYVREFWFVAAKSKSSKAPVRRYEQYCPVARSLDVLGERWTLLVVRDLLMGPRRYTDLRDALPGIATDLLTARLRTLEQSGYVQRRQLPRPAAVTVYELTDSGRRLGRVVLELARLGVEQLGPPAADDDIDTDALVLSLRASFTPSPDRNDEACYQLEVDGEPFTVTVREARVETTRGYVGDAQLAISTSARTLARLLCGAADPDEAIAAGDLRLAGPRPELDRFMQAFAYPRAGKQRTELTGEPGPSNRTARSPR
jgi:DNA-binding HxlR family transcriptional regulator